MTNSLIHFGPYTLDVPQARLLRQGQTLPLVLRPKAFDLLVTLASNPGALLTKDTLLDTVWGQRCITEGVIKSVVSELRHLLDSDPMAPSWIATVPRRGYRFRAIPGSQESATSATPVLAQLPAAPLHAVRGNLGWALSTTIGREEDLTKLAALLQTQRLVTIAGPSGVGKTRLAQTLAVAQQGQGWRDGVWFVELAPLAAETTAAALLTTLAQTLRLGAGAALDSATLGRTLQPLSLLLVLDNAEHLVSELAPLVAQLLAQAPKLCVLLTSQEPLGVVGEQTYRLSPLTVPDVGGFSGPDKKTLMASGAVRLFVERVADRMPGFELGPYQQQAVGDICRALDGLPLALELAAARVPVLGVHGMASLLLAESADDADCPDSRSASAQELGGVISRLHLLNQGARTAAPRHRSLRDALQWSYGLLDNLQRQVFRRLGVFRGGFTLQAARVVCTDGAQRDWMALDAVQALVEKSLVVVVVIALPCASDAPRFKLLESLRAFALEKLDEAGETSATRLRHVQAMRLHWEQADATVHSEFILVWLARHTPEIDNLRAALRYAIAGAKAGDTAMADQALALVAGSAMLWHRAGLVAEGIAACEAVRPHATTTVHPNLQRGFALTVTALATYAYAYPSAETASTTAVLADDFEQAGDFQRAYFSLYCLYLLKSREPSLEPVRCDGDTVLARLQALEQPNWDTHLTRYRRSAMGNQMRISGETQAARLLWRNELARCRHVGAMAEGWAAAHGLTLVELDQDCLDAAVSVGREAMVEIRATGYVHQQSRIFSLWTNVLAHSGDAPGARHALVDVLPALHGSGTFWDVHMSLVWLAAHEKRHETAARLLGWYTANRQGADRLRPGQYIDRSSQAAAATLLKRLSLPTFDRLHAEGATLGDKAAEQLALS